MLLLAVSLSNRLHAERMAQDCACNTLLRLSGSGGQELPRPTRKDGLVKGVPLMKRIYRSASDSKIAGYARLAVVIAGEDIIVHANVLGGKRADLDGRLCTLFSKDVTGDFDIG